MNNSHPKKAKQRINRTKKILKEYECSFLEYMTDSCYRDINIDLGDVAYTQNNEKIIICGWNGSCNFDVYVYDTDTISNMHPSGIKKKKDE